MSNLRTRAEHFSLDGAPWSDFDSEYRFHAHKTQALPSQETTVEAPALDETEQGVDAEAASLSREESPRSIALAVVAANAVHAAWEAGYKLGFNQGRLAGLDKAVEIGNPDFRPTYPAGDKPF